MVTLDEDRELLETATGSQGQIENVEESIVELKQIKAKAKSAFTKCRCHLLVLIQDKETNVEAISKMCDTLDECEQENMDIILRLSEKHKGKKDSKSCFKLSQEIEQLEIEYSSAQNRAQEVLDTMLGKKPAYQPDDHGSGSHIVKKLIRADTVAIGVFRLRPANSVQSQSRVIISRTFNSGKRSD